MFWYEPLFGFIGGVWMYSKKINIQLLTILLILVLAVVLFSSCDIVDYVADPNNSGTTERPDNTLTISPVLPDNFPIEHTGHIFVQDRGIGACDTLKGKIGFLFVFVNDPENVWEEEQMIEYKDAIDELTEQIKDDAQANNIALEISVDIRTADVAFVINNDEYTSWADAVLQSLKLPTTENVNIFLEKLYETDEAPIVFITPVKGRSFAHQTYSENGAEYAVIYNEPDAMYHEICHLFGAIDLYFPASVREHAKSYLPDSIMLNSTNKTIDDMTSFLIGWKDELTEDAKSFLDKTQGLTKEEMKSAFEEENYTGFVTDRIFDEGIYTGQLLDGYCHGQGKFIFNDGDVYEGEWSYNRQHGKGVYTGAEGQTYNGEWVEGIKQGFGIIVYSNGDVYEGEWSNNDRHGQGTYTWSSGGSYTGSWIEGSKNGYGSMSFPNGAKYEGNWVNDRQNGRGVYYWENGDRYDGEWVDGSKNGYGTYYWTSGSYYSGNWLNDCRHGWGQVFYPNGASTVGTWENDQFIG